MGPSASEKATADTDPQLPGRGGGDVVGVPTWPRYIQQALAVSSEARHGGGDCSASLRGRPKLDGIKDENFPDNLRPLKPSSAWRDG